MLQRVCDRCGKVISTGIAANDSVGDMSRIQFIHDRRST